MLITLGENLFVERDLIQINDCSVHRIQHDFHQIKVLDEERDFLRMNDQYSLLNVISIRCLCSVLFFRWTFSTLCTSCFSLDGCSVLNVQRDFIRCMLNTLGIA